MRLPQDKPLYMGAGDSRLVGRSVCCFPEFAAGSYQDNANSTGETGEYSR